MELNTLEDIERANAELDDVEVQLQKQLENYIAKQYNLEALINNITKSLPKLQEISVDAEKLSAVIDQTAALAENVSDKVRKLDITRCRVSECQQRVHDLLDLELCSDGVQAALKNEDYEKAAAHVHRFLSIDQEVLKQTAVDFAEDETTVNNSFDLLQEVTEKLKGVVVKKMNEAIIEEDLASVERFFKIFPLVNLHEEGIAKYALYLSGRLQETSKKNLKTAIDTNRYQQSPNIIFADTITSLLEGAARIIETCQPLVNTYYGQGKLVSFIRYLQKTVDVEAESVIAELILARQIDKKLRQVKESRNNTKIVEKLDSKALGLLLTEITNLFNKTELYFRFLKRRALAELEVGSSMYKEKQSEIENIVDKCCLNKKMHEILGYYVDLERYFLEESVQKAIAIDSLQEGEVQVTSMVDDIFFIVRNTVKRACSSGSIEGICTLINYICRMLETDYCSTLKQQLRQGYPSGYLDLTQAYNALQQGRLQASDPEQAKITFLAYLNDADVSLEYTEALKKSIQDEITSNFGNLSERDNEKVKMCLSGLNEVSTALASVIDYGLKQLKDSAVKPRVSPWISCFLERNHEPSEDEFGNYESGETFIQQLISNINGFLTLFKESLRANNYDALMNVLVAETVTQLEKVILKPKYNRLGALALDRDMRNLTAFFTSFSSWSVRAKFDRVSHMAMLLNLETIAEFETVGNTPSSVRLTPSEVKKVLKRRSDFKTDEIDSLKF